MILLDLKGFHDRARARPRARRFVGVATNGTYVTYETYMIGATCGLAPSGGQRPATRNLKPKT